MPRSPSDSFTPFRLNLWLVGGTLVLLLAFGVGGFFLHRFQTKRLSDAYLAQSNTARDRQERAKEADYLRRYLALSPKDAAARGRLGMLLSQTARRQQELVNAYYTLQDALSSGSDLPVEIRREAVRVALHPVVNLTTEARRELDKLVAADPKNPEYQELYAEAHIRENDFSAADKKLTAAITLDPTRVDAYARQAWVRRAKLNAAEAAGNTITALLTANPSVAVAHLIAAEYYRDAGDRDKWAAGLAVARKLDPTSAPVALAVADIRLVESRDPNLKADDATAAVADAVDLLTKSLDRHRPQLAPADPPPEPGSEAARLRRVLALSYELLVRTLTRSGSLDRAEEWAGKAVEAFPETPSFRLDRVDVLVSRGKLDQAEADLARLDKEGVLTGLMDFQRGRIAVARSRWADAVRHLDTAASLLIANPAFYRRTNLALAECLRQTGEADRRYEAFRRAVPADPLDPEWVPALAGVAETLIDTGRPADALTEYQRLAARAPGANLPAARLLAGAQLRRPKEARDWEAVDRTLAAAPDGPAKDTLRGELLAARGETAKAAAALAEAVKKHPKSRLPPIVLAQLTAAGGDRAAAQKLLADLRATLGDGLDVRLAQADVASGGTPPDAAALPALAEGTDGWPLADRRRLLDGLAAAATAAGRADLARSWLDQLAGLFPEDVGIRFRQFDQAVLGKDAARRQAVVAEIVRLTGPESVPARVVRAFDRIAEAEAGDRTNLDEVAALLVGLEAQRAGWSRLYLAQGRVADFRGDAATAVRKYRQAVELGERNPVVLARLLELYADRRQYAEADQLLRSVPATDATTEMRAQISVGVSDFKRAAELAVQSIPFDSTDARKLRWLSQVLVFAGRTAEAERALRQATRVAPDQPEGWVSLFQLLASVDRKAEVPPLMEAAKAKLSPADLPLALAQGYEVIGRADECRKVFQQLVAARPADIPVLRAAAGFRVRDGDLDGARGPLETILKLERRSADDVAFARRLLAVCLAGGTDRVAARRALEVLGFTDPVAAATLTGSESPEDIRVRVVALLAQSTWAARTSAARLMQTLETLRPLAPDDQFLFGQILASLDDWDRAVPRLTIAARDGPTGLSAAAYLAENLFLRRLPDEARPWVEQVRKAEPKSRRAAILSARLAHAEKKPADEVERPVAEFAATAKQPLLAAKLLDELGLPDRAEKHFRSAADGPGDGSQRLPLALFLARTGRLTPGLAEVEKVRGKLPPAAVLSAECEMFLQGRETAPPEAVRAFVERVEAAANATPAFQSLFAAALSIAGDYERATAVSRDILARDPNDLLALNNLAFLQAMHGKDPEAALATVRRAAAVTGPNANLLDTEAVILISAGNSAAAIDRLQDALVTDPSGTVYAHLAQALAKVGRVLEAQRAAGMATRRNFRLTDLHPLERPAVRKVLDEFGPASP